MPTEENEVKTPAPLTGSAVDPIAANPASVSTPKNPVQPETTPAEPLPARTESGPSSTPIPEAAPAPETPVGEIPQHGPPPGWLEAEEEKRRAMSGGSSPDGTSSGLSPALSSHAPQEHGEGTIASGDTVSAPGSIAGATTSRGVHTGSPALGSLGAAPRVDPERTAEVIRVGSVFTLVKTPGDGGIHSSRHPLQSQNWDDAEREARELLKLDESSKDALGNEWYVSVG